MNTNRQHGFTLWELLMTLLVAGILLGIGVPNVMAFQRNAAMTAAANDFVTAALQARTEAVKRQAPVTVCLSDNPFDATPTCINAAVFGSQTRGYVVFVDENNNFNLDGSRRLDDATDANATVDAGELVLSRYAAPGATTSVRISSNCGYTMYAPTGFTRRATGGPPPPCWQSERIVLLCDDRGHTRAVGDLATARVVRLSRVGRPQVLSEFADVDAWVPSFPTANCN
jgi:type IV fimbrial biogenesis protein FimT